MAFDYCTAADAFSYGNSAGNATDPVNEAAVMAQLVTAVSRAIDGYCEQQFSRETYTLQRLRGVVDRYGVLTAYPPVPTMATPTVAEYRTGSTTVWSSLDSATIDIIERPTGSEVRWMGDYSTLRFDRIDVRLSYVGGYASPDDMPADLVWAAAALSWLTFQRRSAPMDTTAMPELGIVVRPGIWPDDIKALLNRYKKVTPA